MQQLLAPDRYRVGGRATNFDMMKLANQAANQVFAPVYLRLIRHV
jgi:hypothetical protein